MERVLAFACFEVNSDGRRGLTEVIKAARCPSYEHCPSVTGYVF